MTRSVLVTPIAGLPEWRPDLAFGFEERGPSPEGFPDGPDGPTKATTPGIGPLAIASFPHGKDGVSLG